MSETLEVNISYKDMEAEFEGDYEEVWKGVNDTLNKIRDKIGEPQKAGITAKDKDVDEIVQELVRSGFFDKPRISTEVDDRIRELGKTDHGDKAAMMALKKIATEGGVVRKKKSFFEMKGRGYAYVSPTYDLDQHEG